MNTSHQHFFLIGLAVNVGRSARAAYLYPVIHLHSFYVPLRAGGIAISHLKVGVGALQCVCPRTKMRPIRSASVLLGLPK